MVASSKCRRDADAVPDEPEMWVVIETLHDLCIVLDSDIECENRDFSIGDKVKFRWSKQRTLCGTIRFFDCKY